MSAPTLYHELVEALVRELTSDRLEDLPEDLFTRVERWLESLLESAVGDQAREVVDALARECRGIMMAIEEIRRAKSGEGAGPGGVEEVAAPTGGTSHPSGESPATERPVGPPRLPAGKVLVTFKTPLREFVASDLRVYGPFREGDVCLLPVEDAEALEARGVVEVLIGDEGAEQD